MTDLLLNSDGQLEAAFEDCKKALGRRAIEQLGYVKDVNSLVVLTGKHHSLPHIYKFSCYASIYYLLLDGVVTLYPSPTFAPPTLLTQAKGAMSFGIDTSIQYSNEAPDPASNAGQGVPSVVTRLAVGCKRKIVIYTWKDGEAQEVKVGYLGT